MAWQRFAMTLTLLAFCNVAQAQHHPGQQAQNRAPQHAGGAGAVHPQQQHPAFHEAQMWNQWYQKQSNSLTASGNLAHSRSDEILRDEMLHLKSTEASLAGGTERTERHRRVHTAVGHAIHELEIALQIR
jgi:hypothetical protein